MQNYIKKKKRIMVVHVQERCKEQERWMEAAFRTCMTLSDTNNKPHVIDSSLPHFLFLYARIVQEIDFCHTYLW